jgi:site-specific DNA-methyltransferase (cytosine-N4-specific)
MSNSTGLDTQNLRVGYHTQRGVMYAGTIESFLGSKRALPYHRKVQMIFTSPPFPLNRKKRYGNKSGHEYLEWLAGLASKLTKFLTKDGSIVIEMGNAWEPGRPVMSTLTIRALLAFLEGGDLKLCQQFVCHNPARLPSPAQWVNVDRSRVKDAYTHVWWMAKTDRPKATNRQVLVEYSPSMRELLKSGTYNGGVRPSGHKIGEDSFLKDNGGAIPSNVLAFTNTTSTDQYRAFCATEGLEVHPARMPPGLADFFIRMLTDRGDLVFDPFAGSNTTGAVAESLERAWLSVEPVLDYVDGSQARFSHVRPGQVLAY